MDCSTPGFPVLHYLLEFAYTHVHCHQWSQPTLSSSVIPFSSCPQSFPASGSFSMSRLFTSDGQRIEASASVLPMTIQGWFTLELTYLISLQSKALSRVFSSTTVQKHQFFGAQPSSQSNSHTTSSSPVVNSCSLGTWTVWSNSPSFQKKLNILSFM